MVKISTFFDKITQKNHNHNRTTQPQPRMTWPVKGEFRKMQNQKTPHSTNKAEYQNKHKFKNIHTQRWPLTMMMIISICLLLTMLLLIKLLLSHHQFTHDKTAHEQTHVSTNTDVNSMPANDTAHTATALKTQSEIIIKDMTNKDITKNATTENSPAQDDLAKNNSENNRSENNRSENGNLESHQPKTNNNSPILPIIASHDANHDINTTISNSNSGQTTNTQINEQINEQIKQIDERHHAQQQAIKDEHLLSWDLPSNVQQQNRELLTDIALQDQSDLEAQRQIQEMKRQLNDANAKMSEQLEQIRKLAQQQIEQDRAGN